MTNDVETPPKDAEKPRTDPAQVFVGVLLLAIAAYLVITRYASAAVDWHLGDLRRDPGDQDARRALARLGERAIPRLAAELESADLNGRVIAVIALSGIRGPSADRLLARAAGNEDAITAANALSACGRRRDAATAAALGAALGDARHGVRLSARRAAQIRSGGVRWWAFGRAGAERM